MYKKILSGRRGGDRENKKSNNRLKRVIGKEVYAEYKVQGQNLVNLLNKLKKEGIDLFSVKFVGRNAVTLRVKIKDEQKFFAITDNLCYNVKKVKDKGKFLFLYKLLSSPSVIVSALIFIALSVVLSGVIMGVSYTGNGVRYKEEVEAYLNEKGIKEKVLFFTIDLEELSNGILSSSDRFSFVSCKKKGNTLLINLVLAENKTHISSDAEKDLYSNADGVVQEIKLYRGTACVEVGSTVKKGDLLVSGYVEIKEQRLQVNALAVITLLAEKEFTYIAEDNEEEKVKAFALASFNGEAEDVLVDKEEKNGKYYYRVTVYYKWVIYTG